MNDEGLVVIDETPVKKLEMSEREIGRSRMKHRVDRFVNLVEKKETREREIERLDHSKYLINGQY